MKFTTLIPVHYNDGKKVPTRELRRLIDELASSLFPTSGLAALLHVRSKHIADLRRDLNDVVARRHGTNET